MITSFGDEMSEVIKQISLKREFFKNEFCKAYLSHLADKNSDLKNIMERIELVEKWSDDGKSITWFFRERN